MWKKIVQTDAVTAIKVGDIISHHTMDDSMEFTIDSIRKEYVSAKHTSNEGGTEERYFPYAHLYSNNWWLKNAS
jgi:hypothetical protein